MTKYEAIIYFGGASRLAAALRTGKPAISMWGEYPPPLRQIQIEQITGGFLKAEPEHRIVESESERKRRRSDYRRQMERMAG